MIWLAWRQFRGSAAFVAAALTLLVAIITITGLGLADDYSAILDTCTAQRGNSCYIMGQEFFEDHQFQFLGVNAVMWTLPAILGLFWGAPLVTREVEAGTHLLVWVQSITRARWLLVKLGLIGLAAMITVGVTSLAVTWWAGPIDKTATSSDFSRMEPLLFAARGIVPIGYAAFAFALGVTVGILVRRTLPAMAVTLMIFTAVQIAMPMLIRPHLLPPVRATIEISDSNPDGFDLTRVGPNRVNVDAGSSGAWFLSSDTVDASGRIVDSMDLSPSGPCVHPERQDREACLAEMKALGYRQLVTYHPASRFWPFQWIETGIFVTLALALAGFSLWRIKHVT